MPDRVGVGTTPQSRGRARSDHLPTAVHVALAIAIVWGIGLLVAAEFVRAGESSSSSSSGQMTTSSQTLVETNGRHVLIPIAVPLCVVYVVALALVWAWRRRSHRALVLAWVMVGLIVVFNFLAMLSIGIFVVPVTVALSVACGIVGNRLRPVRPLLPPGH